MREETTLTPASLVLLRQGKSYSFSDESIGRSWTIYPFAFRLKTAEEGGKGENGIKIDWEHEGWGWYDPLQVEDVDSFGGVPRLAESLRRVWFEKDLGEAAGRVLSDGLETLKNDHESGARQLAGVALQILRDVLSELDPEAPSDEKWAKVRFVAWHVWKNGRESMGAAIMSVLLSGLSEIEETVVSGHSGHWNEAAIQVLERRISDRKKGSASLVSEALGKYLESNYANKLTSASTSHEPLTILTMSESSTISQGIRDLVLKSRFSLDLRVLESRPLYEGVSLAGSFVEDINEALLEMTTQSNGENIPDVKISLYSDASAALASQRVDVVLIGADRIASTGAVSNKTGSLATILSARHVASSAGKAVKVIVLAESEKIAPPGNPEEHVVEENDPEQITRAWTASYNSTRVRQGGSVLAQAATKEADREHVVVSVHNVFFEWCPHELVDVYMTEFGQWTVDDISKHSQRLGADQDRFFGDL